MPIMIPRLQASENITKPWKFQESDFLQFLMMIRDIGHSKLIEVALNSGLSIQELNNKAKNRNLISFLRFEGVTNRYRGKDTIYRDLLPGLYFGQHLNGMRDGYGLLYCSNVDGVQNIYEYFWERGQPKYGKVTWIDKNQWWVYEGPLDKEYLPYGRGSLKSEDGKDYDGEWLRWQYHGLGKFKYKDGQIYEGRWENHNKHGFGKWTFSNGKYQIGNWINDKSVGTYKFFSNFNKQLENQIYKDDALVFRKEVT
ncbi:hypothetical protein FGO68_gene9538 [Halteria grandinella]|uniref:Uncharacterized protein n=1 Tax=Halteria grandinella TaxID=5974 RepID=A0A8J8T7E0_HALGN|nr:hypothetical protein FGO68_gene9538 [Halteria grandinella]